MVSLGIVTVFGTAALLFNCGLAKPRDPHSPRFPQSSDNSVGEFVLWSCTATAELHKNNRNKNVIQIVTAPGDYPKGISGVHHVPNPPPRVNDAPINKINIIKLNAIPHGHNRKSDTAMSEETKHRETAIHTLDSPLKTIRVNSFRKDTPLIFREKPQLPQVDPHLIEEDKTAQLHSSEITVIKA